jgi:hypothetical protein
MRTTQFDLVSVFAAVTDCQNHDFSSVVVTQSDVA